MACWEIWSRALMRTSLIPKLGEKRRLRKVHEFQAKRGYRVRRGITWRKKKSLNLRIRIKSVLNGWACSHLGYLGSVTGGSRELRHSKSACASEWDAISKSEPQQWGKGFFHKGCSKSVFSHFAQTMNSMMTNEGGKVTMCCCSRESVLMASWQLQRDKSNASFHSTLRYPFLERFIYFYFICRSVCLSVWRWYSVHAVSTDVRRGSFRWILSWQMDARNQTSGLYTGKFFYHPSHLSNSSFWILFRVYFWEKNNRK